MTKRHGFSSAGALDTLLNFSVRVSLNILIDHENVAIYSPTNCQRNLRRYKPSL